MSFPHISINALGSVGQISRPGRPGQSCACGALNGALADIKATGIKANCKKPGGASCTTRGTHSNVLHHEHVIASHVNDRQQESQKEGKKRERLLSPLVKQEQMSDPGSDCTLAVRQTCYDIAHQAASSTMKLLHSTAPWYSR